MGGETISR